MAMSVEGRIMGTCQICGCERGHERVRVADARLWTLVDVETGKAVSVCSTCRRKHFPTREERAHDAEPAERKTERLQILLDAL